MATKKIALSVLLMFAGSFAVAQDYQMGAALYRAKDYAAALKEFRPLANQGDVKGQLRLGVMYDRGHGVVQDFQEAAKWYRLAAEQGNANAQFFLGFMYSKGRGVLQDDQEAVKWYRLAAEQGDAGAQLAMGLHYYIGAGVVQDSVTAHMWLNVAASLGQTGASERRDKISLELTVEQLEQAQKLARECVQKNYQGC